MGQTLLCLSGDQDPRGRTDPAGDADPDRKRRGPAPEGFTDCRLRWRDGAVLIQVPEEQIKQVVQKRKTLLQQLQEWFPQVSLDLQGRVAFDEKPNKKPGEEESQ